MHRLAPPETLRLLERYLEVFAFFPIIAAVLDGRQDGTVYVDDPANPKQAYVEHCFGFAQIFGEVNAIFDRALCEYLTARREFSVEKIRLYTPTLPSCHSEGSFRILRSERQRYVLTSAPHLPPVCAANPVEAADLAEIEARFGVATRFWRTPDDFLVRSHAQVVRRAGQIAAVCYAAATGGGRAEVDVVTDPEFRRQGLGRQAVVGFMSACAGAGLEPVWDCFTNNLPSVRTALSLGFSPRDAPYAFFTIPRA